jgi:hypothetical protein
VFDKVQQESYISIAAPIGREGLFIHVQPNRPSSLANPGYPFRHQCCITHTTLKTRPSCIRAKQLPAKSQALSPFPPFQPILPRTSPQLRISTFGLGASAIEGLMARFCGQGLLESTYKHTHVLSLCSNHVRLAPLVSCWLEVGIGWTYFVGSYPRLAALHGEVVVAEGVACGFWDVQVGVAVELGWRNWYWLRGGVRTEDVGWAEFIC